MTDYITLTGVTATGYHGVFDHEKRDGQTFSADVVLETDHSAAAATDDLAHTVNYAEIAEAVHGLIAGDPRDLIEALAEDIAVRVLEIAGEAGRAVTVTVHKPQAPIQVPFGSVSVTVRRERSAMVLALGANLGDSLGALADAVEELRAHPRIRVNAVSDVARTKAVGGPDGQPDFHNLVVTGTTTLSPRGLLRVAQGIEAAHNRTREVRWGPRTLDIDIIDMNGLESRDPVLTLPHPRAHLRGFVLAPWAWADEGAVLGGRLVSQLAKAAEDTPGIERLGPLGGAR